MNKGSIFAGFILLFSSIPAQAGGVISHGGLISGKLLSIAGDYVDISGRNKGRDLYLSTKKGIAKNIEISGNSTIKIDGGENTDKLLIEDSSLGNVVLKVGNSKVEFNNVQFESLEIWQLPNEAPARVCLGTGCSVKGALTLKSTRINLERGSNVNIGSLVHDEQEVTATEVKQATAPTFTPVAAIAPATVKGYSPVAPVEIAPLPRELWAKGEALLPARKYSDLWGLSVELKHAPKQQQDCLYVYTGKDGEVVSLKELLLHRFNAQKEEAAKVGPLFCKCTLERVEIQWEAIPVWTLVMQDDKVQLQLYEVLDGKVDIEQGPVLVVNNVTGPVAVALALVHYEIERLKQSAKVEGYFATEVCGKVLVEDEKYQILQWRLNVGNGHFFGICIQIEPELNFGPIPTPALEPFRGTRKWFSSMLKWLMVGREMALERKLETSFRPIFNPKQFSFGLAVVEKEGKLFYYETPENTEVKFSFIPGEETKIIGVKEARERYPHLFALQQEQSSAQATATARIATPANGLKSEREGTSLVENKPKSRWSKCWTAIKENADAIIGTGVCCAFCIAATVIYVQKRLAAKAKRDREEESRREPVYGWRVTPALPGH